MLCYVSIPESILCIEMGKYLSNFILLHVRLHGEKNIKSNSDQWLRFIECKVEIFSGKIASPSLQILR
jgi:hypothetical protein